MSCCRPVFMHCTRLLVAPSKLEHVSFNLGKFYWINLVKCWASCTNLWIFLFVAYYLSFCHCSFSMIYEIVSNSYSIYYIDFKIVVRSKSSKFLNYSLLLFHSILSLFYGYHTISHHSENISYHLILRFSPPLFSWLYVFVFSSLWRCYICYF